jgi:hypothetical protein
MQARGVCKSLQRVSVRRRRTTHTTDSESPMPPTFTHISHCSSHLHPLLARLRLLVGASVDGYVVSAACVFLCRAGIEEPDTGDVLGALSLADKSLDHDDNVTGDLLWLADNMLGSETMLMQKEVSVTLAPSLCTRRCPCCR